MLTHRIVAYLISLAVGYWVLTLAEKEKNHTKTIGRVIGWIIIVVSFIGPLCMAGSAIYCRSHWDACAFSRQCPWNDGYGHQMGWDGHCPGMPGVQATPGSQEKSK